MRKSHCPWCDKMVEYRNDRPVPRDHKVRGRDSRFCVKNGQRRRAKVRDHTGRYGEAY